MFHWGGSYYSPLKVLQAKPPTQPHTMLWLPLCTAAASPGGSTVYIIRHGEKTFGGGCLNIQGQERATHLPHAPCPRTLALPLLTLSSHLHRVAVNPNPNPNPDQERANHLYRVFDGSRFAVPSAIFANNYYEGAAP